MSNATKTTTQGALLFIHAQTALHPGSGTALGTVDLPVQRERHTGWPNIAGSALKGVLRDACRERIHQKTGQPRKVVNEEHSDVVTIFGPGKVDESSAHAGALTVSDARILAYPVRSLRGVFAWVTCRSVLERLCRDLTLIGAEPPSLPPTWPGEHRALVPTNSPLLVGQSAQVTIVLEEFDYKVVGPSDAVAKWLAD
ncbi:MAG: type III-B CRISPR module RAMP protein Cmr4, partial [Clostridia bacterium]|nr:type III-B CRISPR module RAMP protein Cmr4 [Clostridia bacterium]